MTDHCTPAHIERVDWPRFAAKHAGVMRFVQTDSFMHTNRALKRRSLNRDALWPHIHACIRLAPCGIAVLRSIKHFVASAYGGSLDTHYNVVLQAIEDELRYDVYHENLIFIRATYIITPKD